MPDIDCFPQKPEGLPIIYAYQHEGVAAHQGYIKVGYTTKTAEERVYEIEHTGGVPYTILKTWSAMRNDGTTFMDKSVHNVLKKKGFRQYNQGEDRNEWFKCSINDVDAAVLAVRNRIENVENRTQDFKMRPEQVEAVNKTISYYQSIIQENSHRTPRFLWNAKMRFGKTFAAYQLAKKMGLKRILVLTFKPAVQSAWREDLLTHIDFEGWQFFSKESSEKNGSIISDDYAKADKTKPIVVFGSFQDLLGANPNGGIKAKNEFIHTDHWDIVIFDEYHFGAWKDNAKKLFEFNEDAYDEDLNTYDAGNAYDETWLPITSTYYLYLSGTPFRALNSGEFIEEQIYNWTYTDEQKAKEEWIEPNNPYEALPYMVMMTYKMPDSIERIAKLGEYDEFDLNMFFSTKGDYEDARFVYEEYVQKWLDLIRGKYSDSIVDELKLGNERPPMPYSDTRLLKVLTHTLWFLPTVNSCYAMANLLHQSHNVFYKDYVINICAGERAGIGEAALRPVLDSMGDPLKTKTITLSCGKLTTGVTIKPWTGIFMLRNMSSPETYFQAAFRVQSPWEIVNENGEHEIVKRACYVFDFAINRALRQIADYSCQLNVSEPNPEKKVEEFIKFLPVLAFDGSSMQAVKAGEILDITMAGTSGTLLARRWESALLVNVDNETLQRLLHNEQAMRALESIEDFRNLNKDIRTIINESEHVKERVKSGDSLTPKESKKLSEEEKEYKSKRKMIQDKLIKFATRIPIFMYLTDYREFCLKDVIMQFEPDLFKKITGLTLDDFALLVSLNVFNESRMNDAVYYFKRYEDSSLSYAGIDRHENDKLVGLFSKSIPQKEFKASRDIPSVEVINVEDAERSKPDFLSVDLNVELQPKTDTAYTEPSKLTKDVKDLEPGDIVIHKGYGQGIVESISDKYIKVLFDSEADSKEFAFPGAFYQGFLKVGE